MDLSKKFGKEVRNGHFEETASGIFLPKSKVILGGVFSHKVMRDGVMTEVQHDHNLVVNQGLNHILDVVGHGATQVTTWYIGLFKGNYTPLATDTAANITANSTEATEYDEATRVEWVEAAAASQSITNSASEATFNINATVTIYGAFMVSASTKSGTTGTLLAASRFTTARALQNLDDFLVTYTLNASDAS